MCSRRRSSHRDGGHRNRHRALARAIAVHYYGLEGEDAEPSRYAVDLAGQIVTNARITVRKLDFFKYSLQLFAGGVLIASAAMAVAAVLAS